MPNHTEVYDKKADQYELLISREDYLGNIPKALDEIVAFDNVELVDLGAGTGRLTCMLAPRVKTVKAFDESEAMLKVTASKLEKAGLNNWKTGVADHRSLPIEDESVDVIIAGWSICYLGIPNIQDWQDNIRQVMSEINRVLRPGGMTIILETQGTGNEVPTPPDFLRGYFALLENEFRFSHRWIRTDYKFDGVDEAVELTRFFFGDELADSISKQRSPILPECTGIWWLRK